MANFDSINCDCGQKIEIAFPVESEDIEGYPEIFSTSTILSGSKVDTTGNKNSKQLETFNEIALNKVYVFPLLVEKGFITEDSTQQITIWNSKQTTETVTNITANSPEGTFLEDIGIPRQICADADLLQDLTVFKEGVPFQNTNYVYSFGGITFILFITGQRIEPFLYEPNWSNGVKQKYKYFTVISNNEKFVEQRRSLISVPMREISAQFQFHDMNDSQRFKNQMRGFTGLILGIPVYCEPMKIDSDPQNQLFLTVSDEIENFFDLLTLTKFLLVKDTKNCKVNEVKEIANIDTGTKTITFTNIIANSYTPSKTIVYPVFLGQIDNIEADYETDYITSYNLDIKEVRL